MNPVTTESLLSHTWFGLIGLMLVLYVITDGFDLGVGILSLFRSKESDRNLMIQSIGHVWDANATWLVKKTNGRLQAAARRYSMIAVVTTVAAAIVISIGTLIVSPIGAERWAQAGVLHVLIALAIVAALAFCYVLYSVYMSGEHGPFNASMVLFVASFAGLAVSLFPDIVPGQLSIAS